MNKHPPLPPKPCRNRERGCCPISRRPYRSPPPLQLEQRRLKLAGFFIPLEDQAVAGGQAFIHLDLSLSLRVAPGAELDQLLEPVLRESIYRFYKQQNRETLRRYSLARGEMLRDLREWLSGKHPELEIATIAFDRYWIN